MSEQQTKSEISPQKRELKLPPGLGDWTTYKPARILVKKIKSGLYGFDRLSETELKTAHMLHYDLTERLLKGLSADLDAGLEFYSIDARQSSYASFIKSFPGQILQGALDLSDHKQTVFFSFDLALSETLLCRALGANAGGSLKREFTLAENLAFETLINNNISAFNEAFNDLFKTVSFKATNSPFAAADTAISEQSSFICFRSQLSVAGVNGTLTVGYTSKLLRALLSDLAAKKPAKQLSLNRLPKELLGAVALPVSVQLGSTSLTAADLMGLEEGDVVSLDNLINNAVTISLGDGRVLLGQPGTRGSKLAVKIVRLEKDSGIKITPPAIASDILESLPEESLGEEFKDLQEEVINPEEELPEDETEGEDTDTDAGTEESAEGGEEDEDEEEEDWLEEESAEGEEDKERG